MRQARRLGSSRVCRMLTAEADSSAITGGLPFTVAIFLMEQKQHDLNAMDNVDDTTIHLREDIADQVRALERLVELGRAYGCDIARPAATAREAVQWLYLAYLGAIKEQNGAAMSLGHNSPFLDIYFRRDLEEGCINEEKPRN